MAIDIWQGVLNGFAAGLGAGLINWLIIKRLDKLESKVTKKPETKTEQDLQVEI